MKAKTSLEQDLYYHAELRMQVNKIPLKEEQIPEVQKQREFQILHESKQ